MTADDQKITEYRAAISFAVLMGRALSKFDYAKLVRDIDYADTVGPLLDPTLWRDKRKAMESDRKIAEAAARFVAALKAHLETTGGG